MVRITLDIKYPIVLWDAPEQTWDPLYASAPRTFRRGVTSVWGKWAGCMWLSVDGCFWYFRLFPRGHPREFLSAPTDIALARLIEDYAVGKPVNVKTRADGTVDITEKTS